jgi:phosphopantetheinyl transferase (holo-ACP synthase)
MPIPKGEGYLFYSDAEIELENEVVSLKGNQFLCKRCIDTFVTASGYQQLSNIPTSIGQPMDSRMVQAGFWAVREVFVKASIVQICQKHGFNPEEAKRQAHNLALAYWEGNPYTALRNAVTFWQS